MRKAIIDFMLFMTKTMSDVLRYFFIETEFKYFDPHVGDTACQIRACMIARIENNPETVEYAKNRITEINRQHAKLEKFKLEANSAIDNGRNNQFTIREFVDRIGIHLPISREEKILFQSYFLTLFKKELTEDKGTIIDYDAISSHLQISRKMAKKIARHYQLSIAHESCRFVFQCEDEMLTPIIEPEIRNILLLSDDDGREVLPCYLYTKIILRYAKQQGFPLVIITNIDKTKYTQCFTANADGALLPMDRSRHYFVNASCIAITVRSNMCFERYQAQLMAIGIEKILLCAMAAHVQYTGKRLSCFSHDLQAIDPKNEVLIRLDREINEMRQLAEQLGCTQYNSDFFLVNHIFCDSMSLHLESRIPTCESFMEASIL